jgi:hypothetical protein
MAGLIPLGSVIDPRKDVFATTGAHLDVRVIPQFGPQKGKKIDPKSAKSLLQNVLVGQDRKPLVQQVGNEWKWAAPVTSGFGPRSAPTAGASSYHEGIDIGLGAGTQLTYKGVGSFQPNKGYGSLMTTDAQGQPYELRFLHTEPGKAASVQGASTPTQATPNPEDSANKLLELLFGQKEKPSLTDQIIGQALEAKLANPSQKFLGNYTSLLNQNPYEDLLLDPAKAGIYG